MKVRLKYNWFAANGRRFRKGDNDIPDEFCTRPDGTSLLPKSAVVLDDDHVADVAPESPETLRDLDQVRAAADATEKALTKAEEFRARLSAEKKPKKKE